MALLLYAYLGYMLVRTHGHFTVAGVIQTTAAFAIFGALRVSSRRWPAIPLGADTLLSGLVLAFCASLAVHHHLIYPVAGEAIRALPTLLSVAFVLAAARFAAQLAGLAKGARRKPFAPLLGKAELVLDLGLAALLLIAQLVALKASPNPAIDVFTITREALDFLGQGLNPYAQAYADIYHGRYGYPAGANYWPGLFWPLLPFHWEFGDFRVAYVAGSIVTAVALRKLALESGLADRSARLGVLAWYAFPVTYFVLEQAWVDSLMLPFVAWGALSLRRGRWALAGALIGYACTVKQYGVVIAWFALLWILFTRDRKAALRFALAAAATVVAVLAPFAIWDWGSFYSNSMGIFLRQPLRPDAHTIPALLVARWGWAVPPVLRLAIAGGIAGVVLPLWLRSRSGRRSGLADWAAAIALAYGAIFLIAQNAFCNYYYFLAFFVLMDFLLTRAHGTRRSSA